VACPVRATARMRRVLRMRYKFRSSTLPDIPTTSKAAAHSYGVCTALEPLKV
jgi:hypothetical protein